MSNQAGSKLKKAVKELSEGLAGSVAFSKDAKSFLQLNLIPVLTMFAENFSEMDEVLGEVAGAVDEMEKFLETEDEGGDSGIEPPLADRLVTHLKEFAALIEQSKVAWSMPEAQMVPAMLAGKEKALADIAALEAENASLIGAVKDARIDEDNPVVSIVPKQVDEETDEETPDDDDDDEGDDDGAA